MSVNLLETKPENPLAGAEWFDSHVHFDVYDRQGMTETILERAIAAGVKQMIAIGGSDEANHRAIRLAETHPSAISAVVGFDRDKAESVNDLDMLREQICSHEGNGIVGIGESGLDYHYEPHTAPAQRKLFESMLELASSTSLPVVVHSREADLDTLEMLTTFVRNWRADPARPGVMHCFTGTYDFARKLLDIGMLISFSGILTFKNAESLRECARKLPLDRILIETDAPYLAPMPFRGKTNEPAMVSKVAETLASIRPDTLQTVSNQTTLNTRFLFHTAKETTS